MRSCVFLVVCAVVFAACGEEPLPDPIPSGPHALYSSDPSSLDNPFPDARLLTATGGLDVSRRPAYFEPFLPKAAINGDSRRFFGAYKEPFAELRGFGNFAPVLVRFSEAIDSTSLTDADGAGRFVFLVDDGAWKQGPAAVATFADDEILLKDGRYFAAVQPELPLPPGKPAWLLLFAGVKTVEGIELVRSPDFHRWATAEGANKLTALAAALGRQPAEVIFAMELKPSDPLEEIAELHEWAKLARPTVVIPARDGAALQGVFRNRPGDDELVAFERYWRGGAMKTHDHVGAVILGKIGARDFRMDGRWVEGRLKAPVSAEEVMLDFVLTLPASAWEGDEFKDGVPVVIAQHGINGRNSVVKNSDDSFCMKLAELFASHGLACLGIDANGHGNRGNLADFFAVRDLRIVRDNFRQTYADLMQLVSAIESIDHDADGTPDLELAPRFFGQSLGGIMGTAFAGIDDRVISPVLNVPGVGLSNILLAARIRDMVGVLFAAESGIEFMSDAYVASFPLLRAIAQLVIDPGDPIHYAALLNGRPTLVQEGRDDLTIPNHTTRALAALAGIPERFEAVSDPTGISALVSFEAKSWGIDKPDYDPHNLFWSVPEQRMQAARFLQSRGTELILERR